MSTASDFNLELNQHLEVQDILNWLEADCMVDRENAHMLRILAVSEEYRKKNPLEVISERGWINVQTNEPLTLEYLTRWLAERVDLPYVRIDPLKIEVTEVTEVMS